MVRVVIDTNVFVSSLISASGFSRKIIQAWEDKKVVVLVNPAILKEIKEVLSRPAVQRFHRLSGTQIIEFCRQIERFSITVESSSVVPDYQIDPDDLKFIDCAISGKADFLITGDKELLNLRKVEETLILTPSEFIQQLRRD